MARVRSGTCRPWVDLARVPLDDDLVLQHLGQCAPINSRQVLCAVWLPLVTGSFPAHACRDCARCGLGCLLRARLMMLRGYPESAVQLEHCQQIVAGPHDRAFHWLPSSF